jgi:ACS family allantoate permease-like MFS transporter
LVQFQWVCAGACLFQSTLPRRGDFRPAIQKYDADGLSQIFGGPIAYGIARGTEAHGSTISPWKIIFLVTGLWTICMSIVFLFLTPDNQINARWLSPKDRQLVIARIRVNQQGVGNKPFKWYWLMEALLDPLSWAFFFYTLVADIPNGVFCASLRHLTTFVPLDEVEEQRREG